MNEYVKNIAGDVRRLIEEEGFPSPRAALDELMNRALHTGAVEPRIWEGDAKEFVLWALVGDDELRDCVEELDNDLFKDAIIYDFWTRLDAEIYRLVCKVKFLKEGN